MVECESLKKIIKRDQREIGLGDTFFKSLYSYDVNCKKNAQVRFELGHFISIKFTYFITTCCVYETPFVETVTKYVPEATSFTGTAID